MSSKRKNNKNNYYLNPQACIFCGSEDDDEVLLGKFIISEVIRVHTNCLFFSSGLSQHGNESQGFLGFLIPDIEAEVRRGRKLFCSYCKKRGATVGCCVTACKKSFHLNCGIQHGSLHQFYDAFRSYCKQHKPKQSPVVPDDYFCNICCEDIKLDEVESCLYSPCCKKKLFHKLCLQRYALSAGMFFIKCPLCNDTAQFVEELRQYGISVPEKDASWELEGNNYEDLYSKPECDGPSCKCPNGRGYCSRRRSGWTLVTCSYCGSHARHKSCDNIQSEDKWLCEECIALNDEIVKNKVISEIGNKSGPCSSNFSLLPKVILEDCLTVKSSLHPGTHYDTTLLNSARVCHKREACHSYASATKSPENSEISEMMEFDDVVNSSSVHLPEIVVNNDNRARRASLIPVISRAENLRDIKNVPRHFSQQVRYCPRPRPKYVPFGSVCQQVRDCPRSRASGKVTKKQKVDNQFVKGNQPLITSYFGHNNETKIRL